MIQAADVGIGISGQEGMQVLSDPLGCSCFLLTFLDPNWRVQAFLKALGEPLPESFAELSSERQGLLRLYITSITTSVLPSPAEHRGRSKGTWLLTDSW